MFIKNAQGNDGFQNWKIKRTFIQKLHIIFIKNYVKTSSSQKLKIDMVKKFKPRFSLYLHTFIITKSFR